MDKTSIDDSLFWVTNHPRTGKGENLHDYGLWIFAWHQDYASPPYAPGVRRYYDFYSLSHMHGGHGWFAAENEPVREMHPGDAVLVGPGFRHGYGGLGEAYTEDSVSFFGPLADQMVRAGMIPNRMFSLGRERRLLPIIELARDPSLESQYRANMLLQQLVLEIFLSMRMAAQPSGERLDKVLQAIQREPARWWQIGELAQICELCESQFRRVFTARIGMRPKEYILQTKIRHAAGLLRTGTCRVTDAAARTGFRDPFHFSRVFKSLTGCSPSAYRDRENR